MEATWLEIVKLNCCWRWCACMSVCAGGSGRCGVRVPSLLQEKKSWLFHWRLSKTSLAAFDRHDRPCYHITSSWFQACLGRSRCHKMSDRFQLYVYVVIDWVTSATTVSSAQQFHQHMFVLTGGVFSFKPCSSWHIELPATMHLFVMTDRVFSVISVLTVCVVICLLALSSQLFPENSSIFFVKR